MSLYNMLFGTNPAAGILLELLGLSPNDFYRFRDCYLTENGEIAVYTRDGGGNRDDNTTDVCSHPNYLRDENDDFDCTYVTYYFSVPVAGQMVVDMLKDMDSVNKNPTESWKKLFNDLQSKNLDDPAVQRAMSVGKKIFSAITGEKEVQ